MKAATNPEKNFPYVPPPYLPYRPMDLKSFQSQPVPTCAQDLVLVLHGRILNASDNLGTLRREFQLMDEEMLTFLVSVSEGGKGKTKSGTKLSPTYSNHRREKKSPFFRGLLPTYFQTRSGK